MNSTAELRSKNFAEYLLYMFHTEDLIRALEFDPEKIDNYTRKAFPEGEFQTASEWYNNLSEMMIYEKIREKGHTHVVNSLIDEAERFFLKLKDNEDEEFNNEYSKVKPFFDEIKAKKNFEAEIGVVEMSLNIIYWYMSQKLAEKEIKPDQVELVRNISVFLSFISSRFRKYESGEYELS